ncbi:MAG: acetoacetate decarboxylase family protein [Alphaproteobacteria bacterium]
MTKITDLKGFSYPTPRGVSPLVGGLPWHFATERMCIAWRSDPAAVAAYLPEPLQAAEPAATVVVDFGRWYCLWDDPDMPVKNPERTWYDETVLWIGCNFQGQNARFCVQTWVNRDFSLLRGVIMGFNKKIGDTHRTTFQPLNPGFPKLAPGTTMAGYVTSHGERLIEGRVNLEREIAPQELPAMLTWPQINLRYFPSMEAGQPPSVCELLQLEASNLKWGRTLAGSAEVRLLPSALEEHTDLEVREVLGGCYLENGFTVTNGKVLHRWT